LSNLCFALVCLLNKQNARFVGRFEKIFTIFLFALWFAVLTTLWGTLYTILIDLVLD